MFYCREIFYLIVVLSFPQLAEYCRAGQRLDLAVQTGADSQHGANVAMISILHYYHILNKVISGATDL